MVIHAFVISKLDSCNSLLAACPIGCCINSSWFRMHLLGFSSKRGNPSIFHSFWSLCSDCWLKSILNINSHFPATTWHLSNELYQYFKPKPIKQDPMRKTSKLSQGQLTNSSEVLCIVALLFPLNVNDLKFQYRFLYGTTYFCKWIVTGFQQLRIWALVLIFFLIAFCIWLN